MFWSSIVNNGYRAETTKPNEQGKVVCLFYGPDNGSISPSSFNVSEFPCLIDYIRHEYGQTIAGKIFLENISAITNPKLLQNCTHLNVRFSKGDTSNGEKCFLAFCEDCGKQF